jgi:hypothetical protein
MGFAHLNFIEVKLTMTLKKHTKRKVAAFAHQA